MLITQQWDRWPFLFIMIMHQSIPAVPIPHPLGNRRHLRSRALSILLQSRDLAFTYPRATAGDLTHVFSKVHWQRWGICWILASLSGTRQTLKVCFLNFRYFFISCKKEIKATTWTIFCFSRIVRSETINVNTCLAVFLILHFKLA